MSYKGNCFHHRGRHVAAAADDSKLNLLVRFLDHAVNDDQLRSFFEHYGDITSSMVMRDIFTGESRGFGFVRFARHIDAARALRECDGRKLGGKAVNVIWAKQQHDDTPAGQDRLRMNKLFLRNVPMDVSEAQLVDLVRCYGTVTEASLHNDKIPAARHAPARRIAFIVFADEGAAEAALRGVHNTCAFHQCHGIPLMGKLSEDYKAKGFCGSASNSNYSSGSGFHFSSATRYVPAMLLATQTRSPPALDRGSDTSTPKRTTGGCSPTPGSSVHLSDSVAEDVALSQSAGANSSSAAAGGAAHSFGVVAEHDAVAGYSPGVCLSPLRTPTLSSSTPKVFRHNPYAASLMGPTSTSL
ncbi:RNA recognition motif (RRM, RBD, or RNP domain) [Novymonas esmeraldas]|uniref:RNA recognition motif (RRM, RBD, or RNP domain) n=1 Tax=Novymonas esmeraldas TaxID=1808958 RepID=A0AAW0ES57_9TRYP